MHGVLAVGVEEDVELGPLKGWICGQYLFEPAKRNYQAALPNLTWPHIRLHTSGYLMRAAKMFVVPSVNLRSLRSLAQ